MLLLICAGAALPYLRSMEVQPTHYGLSGWTSREGANNWVGNTFIANFDSATQVDFFVGDVGVFGHTYNVEIRDNATNALIAHRYNVAAPAKGHVWLEFPMVNEASNKFVRGKEYIVTVTRPSDSINWYRDTMNSFAYGHMEGGGPGRTVKDDLCMRLYGKARVGDEFATHSNVAWRDRDTAPFGTPADWDSCIRRESEVGVKYDKIGYGFWLIVQPTQPAQVKWNWLDTLMMSYADHGVRPIMSFRGGALWATCAYESAYVNYRWIWRPNGGAIPGGLYEGVRSGDSINPDNYYAKYIYEFVRRYGPKGTAFNGSQSGTFWRQDSWLTYRPILLFEGFPEVPSGGLNHYYDARDDGYWRLDAGHHGSHESLVDPVYRETLANHIPPPYGHDDTVFGRMASLASVYARLMIVVDSAVKMACTSPEVDTVRPRSVAYISDDGYYGMAGWLWWLKHYGADNAFDVASCWGYAWQGNPEGHAAVLQQLRNDMHDAGYAPRPVVFTEFGSVYYAESTWNQVTRAYHLSKAYAVMQAANATPGYPTLQCAWFTFCKQYMPNNNWPITWMAPGFLSREPAYAYQQWSALASKADFEVRVPCGDSIFLLQFEDRDGRITTGRSTGIPFMPLIGIGGRF